LHIEKQAIGTADAPPRSITDITAVLDRERENLKAVEAAALVAEGAKTGVLAKFF
jgi:hypothetical protein